MTVQIIDQCDQFVSVSITNWTKKTPLSSVIRHKEWSSFLKRNCKECKQWKKYLSSLNQDTFIGILGLFVVVFCHRKRYVVLQKHWGHCWPCCQNLVKMWPKQWNRVKGYNLLHHKADTAALVTFNSTCSLTEGPCCERTPGLSVISRVCWTAGFFFRSSKVWCGTAVCLGVVLTAT